MSKSMISIIIPTFDRPTLLDKCLQSIYSQKKVSFCEVIVIDNHPGKTAKLIASKYKGKCIYYHESTVGHSRAKNKGLEIATSNYGIFLDDDALLPDGWIQNALETIKKYKTPILGGPIHPYFNHTPPEWYKKKYEQRTFGSKPHFLKSSEYLPTSSTLIHLDTVRKNGGFNPEYGIHGKKRRFGEDTDLLRNILQKSKKKIFYTPKLAVEHYTPPSKTRLTHIFNHQFNLGASDTAVSGDHIGAMKATAKALVSVFITLWQFVVLIWIRDKQKYPYWQNYAWENISKNVYWLGRFYIKIKQAI